MVKCCRPCNVMPRISNKSERRVILRAEATLVCSVFAFLHPCASGLSPRASRPRGGGLAVCWHPLVHTSLNHQSLRWRAILVSGNRNFPPAATCHQPFFDFRKTLNTLLSLKALTHLTSFIVTSSTYVLTSTFRSLVLLSTLPCADYESMSLH